MAAARANWKGFLKIGQLVCPVSLFTAVSSSERIAFQTVDRTSGHRVSREFFDPESGKRVERDDLVKGFEIEKGEYVLLEPNEIEAAIPESTKTLDVMAFVPCSDVDTKYFDRPYFLAPQKSPGEDAFAVIHEAMRERGVAAVARAVLFRRLRSVMLRPHGGGFLTNTLNYDYEVRSSAEVFNDVGKVEVGREMLDLAKHIVGTKVGEFDPKSFDDRYEAAVADLVKAKMEGRAPPKKAKPKITPATDLLETLRASAGEMSTSPNGAKKKVRARKKSQTAKSTRRKAA